jgi:hypothetical protein
LSKLTNLSVSFISLVRAPATGKPLMLKTAEGQRAEAIRIAKTDDERMMAFGIVYAPDETDSHGDTTDVTTIRKAAYEFLREGRSKNVDREHSFTSEMAYVAESWLIRKGDPLFPDEGEGAWAVGIQIGDPDIWRQLKSGELTGISLAGIAHAEPEPQVPPQPVPQWTEKDANGFTAWLKGLFKANENPAPNPEEKEDQMDAKDVAGIVRSVLKEELPGILKEVAKAAEPAPNTPTPTPPAPEGNAEVTALKSAVAALEDKFAVLTAKGATEADAQGVLKSEEAFL